MLHHFKENKRHPKLTQKSLPHRRVRCRYFLSCRRVLHLHSGKHQAFSKLLVTKELLAVEQPAPASAIFLADSWLAWATSLDSALLFCSMTLLNTHAPREWSYFQSFHIPARPIRNCNERIRQSYWRTADKEGWKWEGGNHTFVCLHTAAQSLGILPLTWEWLQYKGRQEEVILRTKWSLTIKGLRNKSMIHLTPLWHNIY